MRILVLLVLLAALPAAVAVNGPATARGTVGASFVLTIDASGASTYAAAPLPAGLSLNPATGRISGAPSAVGVTVTTVTAIGATTATSTITITVAAAGATYVTDAAPMVVSAGSECSFQLAANATGGTYAVTGLPGTLTISSAGLISGTPIATGIYNLDVSADAGVTATTMSLEVLSAVGGAPVFPTPSPAPVAAAGATFACLIAASGADGYSCANLPAWLTLDPVSGLLSGTPAAGDGPANLRLTAHGTAQSSTMLAIPVAAPASGDPLASAPPSLEGTVGSVLTWRAVASGAVSFALSGLPAGLLLDPTSGLLSGTPSAAGDFTATLTATPDPPQNAVSTSIALRIHPAVTGAPTIAALTPPVLTVGAPAAFVVPTGGGAPTSFGGGDLSPFAIDATGLVSGTPDTAGDIPLLISASNAQGSAVTTILVQIADADTDGPLPADPVLLRTTAGAPFSAALAADIAVDVWTCTGLPSGIVLAPFTGHLVGSTATVGSANLVVNADDADGGNATHAVLRVSAAVVGAPQILAAGPWFIGSGQPVGLRLLADVDASWVCAGLPTGLTADATGLITGSSTVAGTHTVEISATAGGLTTLSTAVIVVEPAVSGAPVLSGAGVLDATVGVPFSATLVASNAPDWFSVSPLPAWLTLVSATGALSGTPTASGTVVLQVIAGNAAGSARSLLTLRIAAAPAVTPTPVVATPVSGLSGGGCGAGVAGLLVLAGVLGLRRRRLS